MFKLYQITFDDGFKYLGVTNEDVENRVKRHETEHGGNADLQQRMAEMSYTVSTLSTHEFRVEAITAETELVGENCLRIHPHAPVLRREGFRNVYHPVLAKYTPSLHTFGKRLSQTEINRNNILDQHDWEYRSGRVTYREKA